MNVTRERILLELMSTMLANKVADYTVFVSKWLKATYNEGYEIHNSSVIMSGSDSTIFINKNYTEWKKKII